MFTLIGGNVTVYFINEIGTPGPLEYVKTTASMQVKSFEGS